MDKNFAAFLANVLAMSITSSGAAYVFLRKFGAFGMPPFESADLTLHVAVGMILAAMALGFLGRTIWLAVVR